MRYATLNQPWPSSLTQSPPSRGARSWPYARPIIARSVSSDWRFLVMLSIGPSQATCGVPERVVSARLVGLATSQVTLELARDRLAGGLRQVGRVTGLLERPDV